jgi:hypothetical protein
MPISKIIRIAGLVLMVSAGRAATIGSPITSDGYTFTNFDGSNAGNFEGTGTNINGIANSGGALGFTIDNAGNLTNFVRNPNGSFTGLNLGFNPGTMANGINSAGDIVGTQNGNAFFLRPGGSALMLLIPGFGSTALGIDDQGNIVGQYNVGSETPGFFLASNGGNGLITINAPSGPNVVNAQGVNDNGLVVGFYLGTDGQDHGFQTNVSAAQNGNITATPLADPRIPKVPGEPGATFVFSQILGVNDNGIAVGYYGDSTTSLHGFLYNTKTGAYTFLDDPAEQFDNGVEVTQITGITDSGEIAGFYSDSSGVFHGFVACPSGQTCAGSGPAPVPEPGSLVLASFGAGVLACVYFRRRRNAAQD